MNRLFTALVAAAALWIAACSGGGSTITPPPPTGKYGPSSLNGTYAFAAGDEGIGTVQAGGTIFAGRRRRRDSGTAATAGRNPKGSRCDERCKQAVHRTPRRASLCAGVKVEAGLSGKPLALRTATASAPFCTT